MNFRPGSMERCSSTSRQVKWLHPLATARERGVQQLVPSIKLSKVKAQRGSIPPGREMKIVNKELTLHNQR